MKKKIVILIAEDDTGHFILVRKNLWRSCTHNDILHFKDGQEILDFLFMRKAGARLIPGTSYVLLLDISMPGIDGMEVLRQIKADQELRKIPVIILTTTENPREIQRCYELGCSLYIVKPTNYNDFMSCVDHLGEFLSLPEIKIPQIAGPKAAANV